MSITIKKLLELSWIDIVDSITGFIKEYLIKAKANGFVIGLSGGVDSSTTLALAVKAVGSDRVYAVIMPDSRITPKEDVEDAEDVARRFNVPYSIVYIDKIYDVFKKTIPWFSLEDNIANGNIRARTRMIILYYYANRYNHLVLGTSDRSEILIGYFTKYGDGAVDLLPLGALYKTQVRRLALELGIPENIAYKPSSPRLWPGHEAEEELGMSYEEIDLILYSLFDLGLDPGDVSRETGLSIDKVYRVLDMHRRSRHKRSLPPIPCIPSIREPVREI